jgi:hypothetical protein
MPRDHGLHNLLCTPDGLITKAIDWGTDLSYEPLGVSLGHIETYVEGSLELRQEFWDSFTAATQHWWQELPETRRAMKTAKDIGYVVSTLRGCKNRDQVTTYHLRRLEKVLLDTDCVDELNL